MLSKGEYFPILEMLWLVDHIDHESFHQNRPNAKETLMIILYTSNCKLTYFAQLAISLFLL